VRKHEKLQIYNKGNSLSYFSNIRKTSSEQFRSQELSQLNEKLRLQLAEKEGTITTLTRAHQTQHQSTVSLILNDTFKK
jgi:hypothetical protein